MNRRDFLGKLILASAAGQAYANADAVKSPPLFYPGSSDKKYYIKTPGKYAFFENAIQRQLFGGGHTGPSGGYLMHIGCGSVDVDFRGHTLGSDYGQAGITLWTKQNVQFANQYPEQFTSASLDNRFVSLHDGKVDLARGKETLPGIEFMNEWAFPFKLLSTRPMEFQGRLEVPISNIQYVRNDYRFERLEVLANDSALSVEGSHTVIRNCVIESSGNTAIFIAGPNVTIENCEIRLRKPIYSYAFHETLLRAAILLRDGDNAIIRNNRIRIDYGDLKTEDHCILVRDGAKNVLIENNTFINVRGESVSLTDGSGALVQKNQSVKRFTPF